MPQQDLPYPKAGYIYIFRLKSKRKRFPKKETLVDLPEKNIQVFPGGRGMYVLNTYARVEYMLKMIDDKIEKKRNKCV